MNTTTNRIQYGELFEEEKEMFLEEFITLYDVKLSTGWHPCEKGPFYADRIYRLRIEDDASYYVAYVDEYDKKTKSTKLLGKALPEYHKKLECDGWERYEIKPIEADIVDSDIDTSDVIDGSKL